jgi:hypothetical protein
MQYNRYKRKNNRTQRKNNKYKKLFNKTRQYGGVDDKPHWLISGIQGIMASLNKSSNTDTQEDQPKLDFKDIYGPCAPHNTSPIEDQDLWLQIQFNLNKTDMEFIRLREIELIKYITIKVKCEAFVVWGQTIDNVISNYLDTYHYLHLTVSQLGRRDEVIEDFFELTPPKINKILDSAINNLHEDQKRLDYIDSISPTERQDDPCPITDREKAASPYLWKQLQLTPASIKFFLLQKEKLIKYITNKLKCRAFVVWRRRIDNAISKYLEEHPELTIYTINSIQGIIEELFKLTSPKINAILSIAISQFKLVDLVNEKHYNK